jgi:GNAT superfamily N-acetyltransferase
MTLHSNLLSAEDFPFFLELVVHSEAWKSREIAGGINGVDSIRQYVSDYKSLNGEWLLWQNNDENLAVTFHVMKAPSNGKSWLGTVLVAPHHRQKGWGKRILETLAGKFKQEGKQVMFTAAPVGEDGWSRFLGKCGFEQSGLEKSNQGIEYLIYVKPL